MEDVGYELHLGRFFWIVWRKRQTKFEDGTAVVAWGGYVRSKRQERELATSVNEEHAVPNEK
jgi:hypothetical protein